MPELVQPEAAANELLDRYWQGGSQDPVLAVDPVQIARSLDIQVYVAAMDPGASGALVGTAGQDPVIYLNAADGWRRQRFSCAHELGHYLHLVNRGEMAFDRVEWRNEKAARGTDPAEIYANGVAAALLMPSGAVRRLAQSKDVFGLAEDFQVSMAAMGYRLQNLRVRAQV